MHDFIVSIYFEPISKNHGRRGTGEWLASGVPLLNKFFLLFISSRFRKSTVVAGAYVTRQHCGSGLAGGHPPAKIVICVGTRLLAGVALAGTNAF
jgi:hypothetical protein